MNISLLAADRYDELLPIFEEFNGIMPSPESSAVVIAEEDNEIKAFWVLEAQVHAEPLWVREDSRVKSGAIFKQMAPLMLSTLQNLDVKTFFCTTEDENMVQYMQRLGLEAQPFVTFMGVVPPKQE